MLTSSEKDLLRIIARSDDIGDGWRQCSDATWTLVEQFRQRELIDTDEARRRVALTTKGWTVVKYAL